MHFKDYNPEQQCPECSSTSVRLYTAITIHQGRTLAQKTSGASKRTIEHGKYMKDAREKRKRKYAPDSREAQSNELWVGSEVQDEVIKVPEKQVKKSKT
jgi:hypothetical protein